MTAAWGGRAPATWNRHVATVRSFLVFCQRRRWLAEDLTVDLERRPELADRTKAIPWPSSDGCGAATSGPREGAVAVAVRDRCPCQGG